MQFSIIITLYNRADKVQKALDSVLTQSFSDYEIVIVDDGSSDQPELILQSYFSNEKIKFIQQANQGPAGAKNRGAREASGKFIIFLDSDDWFKHNDVLHNINRAITNDISFLAFNQLEIIRDDKTLVERYVSQSDLVEEILRYPLNYAACPPYVFQRNLFLEVKGFNLDFRWGDALLFWRKYLPKTKIKILNDVGYVYDQRGEDSVSRKKDRIYLKNVFTTLDTSYIELKNLLIEKGYNKEWEIVLLGVSLKCRDYLAVIKYLVRILSNNQSKILGAILYIIKRRTKR